MIRYDVFPFTRDFVDTALVYRYREVGPGDTTTFLSWIAPHQGPSFRSTFTFKKGIGLLRNSYNSGSIDVYSFNEHVLINSIITSVARQVDSSFPSSFQLYQNYPNPFNPTAVIRYQLTTQSHVILKIYNLLGQHVRTLVNEIQNVGYQSAHFDASALASGMYFYWLDAVSTKDPSKTFTQVRKMVLMR